MNADLMHLVTLLCKQAESTSEALTHNRDKLSAAEMPGLSMDAHELASLSRQVRSALKAERTKGAKTPMGKSL